MHLLSRQLLGNKYAQFVKITLPVINVSPDFLFDNYLQKILSSIKYAIYSLPYLIGVKS